MEVYFKAGNHKQTNTIRVQCITPDGKSITISSGIPIKYGHWDYERQRVQYNKSDTNFLKMRRKFLEVELAIYQSYEERIEKGQEINKDWLNRTVLAVFNRPQRELDRYAKHAAKEDVMKVV